MSHSGADNTNFRIILQSEDAPKEFIADLAQSILKKSTREAADLALNVEVNGGANCGSFSSQTAIEMLIAAQAAIRKSGHPVEIVMEVDDDDVVEETNKCALCGKPHTNNRFSLKDEKVLICDDCIAGVVRGMPAIVERTRFRTAFDALSSHFIGLPRDGMIATARKFPGHMRADLQLAFDQLLAESTERFFGINEEYCYGTLTFAALNVDGKYATPITPAQYHEVDVGGEAPVRCLHNGLWLCRKDSLRYAAVLSIDRRSEENDVRIEIVAPPGEAGVELSQACFDELEKAVSAARSYRGKTLSFDSDEDYRGRSRGVLVHRLPTVRRDDVILPDATLKLLDRNVVDFVGKRAQLRQLGQSARKGILLYGPPGTGKTHTIRYLASNLPDYTTLVIAGAQMGLLTRYMNLARLMQPALVVIEDVDLIARRRENMGGACEESLLNQLLNQMDGLREDADIIFVLTTNRPEQLEEALANRPGRIDQAIEVPLPDEAGRRKLIRLYGRGLPLADSVVEDTARRTEGVSAAFIKELMRRVAQESIARSGGESVLSEDVGLALQDMLFSSGKLNVRLLGGADAMAV